MGNEPVGSQDEVQPADATSEVKVTELPDGEAVATDAVETGEHTD